jgi:hypothetical protein
MQDTKHPLYRIARKGIKELINDSVGTEGDFKNQNKHMKLDNNSSFTTDIVVSCPWKYKSKTK